MANRIVGFYAFRQGNNITVVNSDGDIIDKPPYLTELVTRYRDFTCIAYDIDYLTACLMYAIGITKEQGMELHKTEHLRIPPWHIAYFPDKFLGIDYGSGGHHPFVNFCNMNQAGYGKAEYSDKPITVEEAIGKAKEARDIGMDVARILNELGLDSSSINSPVTPFLRKYSLNWPTVDFMPTELVQMSIDAVKGHLFEVHKLGKFDAWDADVNGAYLYHLSYLPSLDRGEFIHVKGNEIPNNATLGVAKGMLTTEAPLHPFMVEIDGVNYTPVGTFSNTLTLFDIKFMREYNLATFDISEGWYWIPKRTQHQPYRGAMLWLWQQRQNTEGRKRLIIQRIYSSLVGKQIEGLVTSKYGKMFCPFVPAHVEAATRIQVIKTCLDYKIHPLAITGDGFVSEHEIDMPLSDELGGWKMKQHNECLSIGSNVIMFKDGKNKGDYDDILASLSSNPKSGHYSKIWNTPVSLAVALQQRWEDLAEIRPLEREFSIDVETKRLYPDRPKNGYAFLHGKYDSMPWNYETLVSMRKTTV